MATGIAASLGKGLRMCSAIIADGGRSTLTEIARQAGLPLATAHRLALTLEAEGFLVRGRKGYYHAGPVLVAAIAGASEAAQTAGRLRQPLARLARQHAAFSHFGVLEDGMVTYLVKEKGLEADLFTEERMQLEAYCSAVGKVLLANLPEAELAAYLANGPFVALTGRTLAEPAAIRAEVEEVRRSGVGFDRCEIREDLFCMAVAVRGAEGNVVGAISLSMLERIPGRDEQRRVIQQLRAIAAGGQPLRGLTLD